MAKNKSPFKAASVWELPAPVEAVIADAQPSTQFIVLVTGVFDILHQEHITFLRKAKELGGVLIVGVESDERTRVIKGEGRPVYAESIRLKNLMALEIAHHVFILPEAFNQPDHYRGLIQHLKPKYLAVSSHTAYLDVKQKMLAEVGGEVAVVHQHNPAISTTQILAKKSPKS